MTTINRLISASNRIKRENHNKELINLQGGNDKERDPIYKLGKVETEKQLIYEYNSRDNGYNGTSGNT